MADEGHMPRPGNGLVADGPERLRRAVEPPPALADRHPVMRIFAQVWRALNLDLNHDYRLWSSRTNARLRR